MGKTYLDGKVKLKEPTYRNIMYLGVLLEKHGFVKMCADKEVSKNIIEKLCLRKKDFDFKDITPVIVAGIIVDYFSAYFNTDIRETVNAR